MIKEREGKSNSIKTPEEIEKEIQAELSALSPAEKEVLKRILKESQANKKSPLLNKIRNAEFKTVPVDMKTFVLDEYYLGKSCSNIYPLLLKDLEEMFRGNYTEIILGGSTRSGKCVCASTYVFDAATGERRRVDQPGNLQVASLNEATGRLENKKAACFASGIKSCVRVTLREGSSVELSTDHPVYTINGWVEAAQLKIGDWVATPRTIPKPTVEYKCSDSVVKIAAYLLADGGTTASTCTFTNADPLLFEELALAVQEEGKPRNGVAPGLRLIEGANTGKASHFSVRGISDLMHKYKLHSHSRDKRIPAEFWGLSDSNVALFINRFFACDGHVQIRANGGQPALEITLASEGLIDDLKFLLLRLGVFSSKHYKKSSYINKKYGERRTFDAWRLTINGEGPLTTFFDKVGYILGKEEACAKAKAYYTNRKAEKRFSNSWDVIPMTNKDMLEILRETGNATRVGHNKWDIGVGVSTARIKFKAMVRETGYKGRLAWLADSDVYWSRVTEVASIGEQPVYDLSVPGTHNFIGNNIVLHNTFLASIALCRLLYELSCLRDPYKSFNLAQDSGIFIVGFSRTEALAKKVVFENIAAKIAMSPYFKDCFPFEETKSEMRFPNKVEVWARSSNDKSALGLNVISALIDEANFMDREEDRDVAENLYNIISRRIENTFKFKAAISHKLFIMSSKNTTDDFVNRRIKAAANEPGVFVRDRCLAGSTAITLLDGTDVTLKELAETKEPEDHFWVYGFDARTRLVTPARSSHPRITHYAVPTVKVALSNGKSVVCTPDHRFLTVGGVYIEAKDLDGGTRLQSFYPRSQEYRDHAVRTLQQERLPSRSKISKALAYPVMFSLTVVSVEEGEVEDVYDLSVEHYENFALSAGVVVHNSIWEVQPEAYANSPRFWVLCGNEVVPSKIVDDPEELARLQKAKPENTVLVDVPVEFRPQFEKDLEGGIKDTAGISVISVAPFINRREKLISAIDTTRSHPFTTESLDPSEPGQFIWEQMVTSARVRQPDGSYAEVRQPKLNPNAIRHVHFDPAIRWDSFGVCVAHIGGWTDVTRLDNDNKQFKERAPIYVVDFVLQITPPIGGEIILATARDLIYAMSKEGYPISKISIDGQNKDALQILSSKGYKTEYISVDKTMEPYENLKAALYEDRIRYYRYEPLLKELRTIQRVIKGGKQKVEHLSTTSKDIADALAGCLYTLSQSANHAGMPILRGQTTAIDNLWMPEQRGAAAGGDTRALENTSFKDYGELPAFMEGQVSRSDFEDRFNSTDNYNEGDAKWKDWIP